MLRTVILLHNRPTARNSSDNLSYLPIISAHRRSPAVVWCTKPTLLLWNMTIKVTPADGLQANIDWKSPFLKGHESVWPKISGRTGRHPRTNLRVRKTRCIDLSYGIRMWAELSFVLSKFTRLTDGQTALRSLRPRCMIQYSAAKTASRRPLLPMKDAFRKGFDICL